MIWHRRPLCGLDLETSGTNPERDCIVTAAVVRYGGGQPTAARTWVAVPEFEIPADATAVHGWTTEEATAQGQPAPLVVAEVIDALVAAVDGGHPVVVMNAPFDLTLIDRAARRFGVVPLADRVTPYVLDPRVLDKQVDRYRKGHRRLEDLCRHYCVSLDGPAHDSKVDAVAACDVTWRIANRHRWMQRKTLAELHAAQEKWAYQQNASFRDYLARTPGRELEALDVRLDWPMVPAAKAAVLEEHRGAGPLAAMHAAGEIDSAEYHYCTRERSTRAHAVTADGGRKCWGCGMETAGNQ
ncbi:exonuclease domain-containing protein [Streptomyces sp. OK228]|uniref:exonuclease domain-containing protein n=1 Tax=Streptomyces sp. OK228 TaxID=1882786 RepID=UPI000BD75D0A|nr:exonuclease domain-containing protein [Streptomyces sp. OK228]SOE31694.1 DNA polymerase-3 subunit epsilon [Streptomyces sp. OK228]